MFNTEVFELEVFGRIVAIVCIAAPILFWALFDLKKCRKCGSRLADRTTRSEIIPSRNKVILAISRYRICYRCGDKMLLRKKIKSGTRQRNKKKKV